MNSFEKKRRQPFITERFWIRQAKWGVETLSDLRSEIEKKSGKDADDFRRLSFFLADDSYQLLSLDYTAGQPIESMRNDLEQVVSAYELYQKLLSEYEGDPEFPPLNFEYEIADYERCMQLIGLCYLLHRRDLLPRIAKLQDPAYAGEDTLYEELLGHALPDRADIDEWYHDAPYTLLIQAMYAHTPELASTRLGEYCQKWYPAMAGTPWHGSHERTTEDEGDYFGYWAFEAGAVALLYNIDDSKIDHMVYPRDLVAFARSFRSKSSTDIRVDRVPGGQVCPRSGWWYSPADAQSRHHFKQGDIFPVIESSDYGETFWLWSPNQSPPKLA